MSARPAIHRGSPKLKFSFAPAREQSVLGGPPAIEAPAQGFGLWVKLRALRRFEPRQRTGGGFGREALTLDLRVALKALYPSDECQGWQVRTPDRECQRWLTFEELHCCWSFS